MAPSGGLGELHVLTGLVVIFTISKC